MLSLHLSWTLAFVYYHHCSFRQRYLILSLRTSVKVTVVHLPGPTVMLLGSPVMLQLSISVFLSLTITALWLTVLKVLKVQLSILHPQADLPIGVNPLQVVI